MPELDRGLFSNLPTTAELGRCPMRGSRLVRARRVRRDAADLAVDDDLGRNVRYV
jgi:hypothetical protein